MRHYENVVYTAAGQAVPNATITVYAQGTLTLATLFIDALGVTSKANPFTGDVAGRFDFFAVDGRYDIQISAPNFTTYTLKDVEIAGVMGSITTLVATILAGQSLSATVVMTPNYPQLVGLVIPAGWTAAPISFQGSVDNVLFNEVVDTGGNAVGANWVITPSRHIVVPLFDFSSFPYLKVRSGTSLTPVVQASQVAITLVLRQTF